MLSKQAIIDEARTWLHTPWKHQGRTKRGVDCLGLLVSVAANVGMPVLDEKVYTRRPDGKYMIQRFREEMQEISIDDVALADVVLFADSIYPCHVAFISEKHGQKHIIHAHALRRMVIEELYSFEWPGKARRAFRLKGLN